MPMEPGQLIGDYEILGVLGAGGMGRVYKVRSVITQRVEAMKVLLADYSADQELGERFVREIRICAALDHPHIASLRAAQRVENQLLMIMEFVDGATLSDLMHRGPVSLSNSLGYVSQALAALEYAHGQNVIHRDIKPSNIMVTPANQVKLMDFGVARLTTDAKLTKTGFLVGSLFYMSPELIENGTPNVRSDIYAIGVTLYELVTGKRPFDGNSEYQIMAAHLKGSPVPPSELDASVPNGINDIILTALAREPERRFASAKAMRAAIDSVLQRNSSQTVPVSAAQQASPPQKPAAIAVSPIATGAAKSHRTAYMLAGSLVTVVVLVGAAIELPNLRHAEANAPKTPPVAKQVTPPPNPAVLPTVTPAPGVPLSSTAEVAPKLRVEQTHPPVTAQTKQREPAKAPLPPSNEPASTQPARENVVAPVPATITGPRQATAVPDTAHLSEARDHLAELGARAAAVHGSLDNLKRAQAQAGYGLRGDIVASEQRLDYLLNEADGSLQKSDAETAQKRLEQASTELEKLEKFLGR